MKSVIQLHFSNQEQKKLDTTILSFKETAIHIHQLSLLEGIYLFEFNHSQLNTLIDFTGIQDFQVLYFDADKKFISATYCISNSAGSYMVQTQAKWILLIPFEHKINHKMLNDIIEFRQEMK